MTIQKMMSYLKDVWNTLIVQDIIKKYRIKNKSILQNITNFLISNVSNTSSVNTITNTLNSNGVKITNKTTLNYMNYLVNAFAFYNVKRYDIVGKRYLSTEDKFYLADTSFYYAMLGTKNLNTGHIFENIVAIELLRRGYEMHIGKLYKKEVDFVCKKNGETLYIQVSDDISQQDTFEGEIEPLLKIKDAYPKMIIARTKSETYSVDGISIVDIANWLAE